METSITINERVFNGIPEYCLACPFFASDGRDDVIYKMGFCILFRKRKSKYINIPKRCKDLFKKGFETGGDLVIVQNVTNNI
jgi:hypothetical protein